MIETNTLIAQKEISNVTRTRLCPDCNTVMAEIDRVKENGFSFIWYQCTKIDCDCQWLEKKLD